MSKNLDVAENIINVYDPLHQKTLEYNAEPERENSTLKQDNTQLRQTVEYMQTLVDQNVVVTLYDNQRKCFATATQ